MLLLLACADLPDRDPPPSARLAARAGVLSREAEALAVEVSDLDGLFDRLRVAPPEERAALVKEIRERSAEVKAKASELRDDVADLEAAAQVYP